jgi:farnesyl diphosphate synthase
MHRLKTGALLRSAIRFGAILGGLSAPNRSILDQIAQDIGLGFQVTDDILDATQDSSTLGKTAGKDEEDHKPTFVTLMGLEKSKLYAQELLERSLLALNYWGSEADPLREITRWAFTRNF